MQFEKKVVDTSTNSTVISTKTCALRGVFINTTLSAHTVVIEDAAGTAIFTIPASTPAGTSIALYDVIAGGLTVNPDDSSTGNLTIAYAELN